MAWFAGTESQGLMTSALKSIPLGADQQAVKRFMDLLEAVLSNAWSFEQPSPTLGYIYMGGLTGWVRFKIELTGGTTMNFSIEMKSPSVPTNWVSKVTYSQT
jgi:hypothetical protein